jgi:hypothetical protein
MKALNALFALLAVVVSSHAQSNFIASLEFAPHYSPGAVPIPAQAEFALEADSLAFTIRFGQEDVLPTTAYLYGISLGPVPFDLGPPSIVIHSPGPWPDGYDGSTSFSGTIPLSDSVRAELLRETIEIILRGSALGDFRGSILAHNGTRPALGAVERTGSNLRFHFTAEPLFEYALEATASLNEQGWASVTNFVADGQTAEAVFTGNLGDASMQFYRIRKQSGVSGLVGRSFIYVCPVIGPGAICLSPYPTGITIKTEVGDFVTRVTTDGDGRFEKLLAPGRYVLVPDPGGIPNVADKPIVVWPKQLTTVVIVYDSGIR